MLTMVASGKLLTDCKVVVKKYSSNFRWLLYAAKVYGLQAHHGLIMIGDFCLNSDCMMSSWDISLSAVSSDNLRGYKEMGSYSKQFAWWAKLN